MKNENSLETFTLRFHLHLTFSLQSILNISLSAADVMIAGLFGSGVENQVLVFRFMSAVSTCL